MSKKIYTCFPSYLFIIVVFILVSSATYSQDTIVKNNGEQIECTILEVTPTFVKCSKFNSQNETIYRIVTSDIFKIVYVSGETTFFVDIAAAVPAACPTAIQVAITRMEAKAL